MQSGARTKIAPISGNVVAACVWRMQVAKILLRFCVCVDDDVCCWVDVELGQKVVDAPRQQGSVPQQPCHAADERGAPPVLRLKRHVL